MLIQIEALTGLPSNDSAKPSILEQFQYVEVLTFVIVVAVVSLVLFVMNKLNARADRAQQFTRQLIMLGLSLVGLAAIVLALPLSDSLIQSLLSLIGLILSAVVALSATTFMGNALAGIMLRTLKNFKAGDFIRSGEHFGRVTERGLIHTEIQTEDSDLTTLPNLFLVTHPLTTVRSTGTIVSATVSLGYDVSRSKIQECLLAAATNAALGDPFVQILDLGDFSVTYRIAGFSENVKELLTLRSRLRESMMDELHAAGVEIVSPTFMNQRAIKTEFIPETASDAPTQPSVSSRSVFDKAEAAESYEFLLAQRDELIEELKEIEKLSKTEEDHDRKLQLETRKASKERRLKKFDGFIAKHEEEKKSE